MTGLDVQATRQVEPAEWVASARALLADGFTILDVLAAAEAPPGAFAQVGNSAPSAPAAPGAPAALAHLGTNAPGAPDAPAAAGALAHLGTSAPACLLLLRVIDPAGRRTAGLRTLLPAGEPVPSLTGVWAGAAWHEREIAEMLGLDVAGFDDGSGLGLRPLLLGDAGPSAPLRRSFELTPRGEKRWPGAKEPGESEAEARRSPSRRKLLPPGIPEWGQR
ncbi:MAG: NADH-quinone oxidoreductase subunit C [Micrococcales bacterium]|nr:NADH-quinone oxidoreductase subunit C [Micrococcales bacterium]